MSSGNSEQLATNLNGCGKLWLCHEVSSKDTMVHLALKYGTTVGQLCRANRMHYQDVIQMRRYIWLPVVRSRSKQDKRDKECPLLNSPIGVEVLKAYAKVATLPPHFYRQSTPNVDDFAEECDPLLITTKCM